MQEPRPPRRPHLDGGGQILISRTDRLAKFHPSLLFLSILLSRKIPSLPSHPPTLFFHAEGLFWQTTWQLEQRTKYSMAWGSAKKGVDDLVQLLQDDKTSASLCIFPSSRNFGTYVSLERLKSEFSAYLLRRIIPLTAMSQMLSSAKNFALHWRIIRAFSNCTFLAITLVWKV